MEGSWAGGIAGGAGYQQTRTIWEAPHCSCQQMEQGWHGKRELQEQEALLPPSMPAPLPGGASLALPCPALEGSHLSCRLSFCFPLPARGSVPKLSWDEGKPFPGLPPCTSTCRKLSTAQQGGLMSVKAFILASPLVHACPCSHVHRHAHTLLCLAVDYFEQWRSSTYLCSPSISPKLVQHHCL